ncbi:MAG: dTDP-4-dehydrorhamnose 3,5-epimerase family protein [Candidatus Nanopelagicales bacterium]|jgi:dTDP-4-dehydrorhamnose 3,5-epimerase
MTELTGPLDNSYAAATADTATVTKDGRRLESRIDGVRTAASVVHSDHRGRVYEIYAGADDFWSEPIVYCYAFTVRANQVKGWGLHLEKHDRYTLISGELTTVLYDARLESPTHGAVQRVTLSEQGVRRLHIPRGVWHMNINVSERETHLINHPTEVYHHERPDRLLLPWNTSEIPFDVATMFPVQLTAAVCDC